MVSMIVCGYTELNWIAFYSSCDYFSGRGVSLNTDGKIDFFSTSWSFLIYFFQFKVASFSYAVIIIGQQSRIPWF